MKLPKMTPAMKGTENSGDGDADRGASDAAHQLQIGLHARQQEKRITPNWATAWIIAF